MKLIRRKPEGKSKPELIKELDKWFSRFIRLRDSDKSGFLNCCTCGRHFYWKAVDCGHYSKRNKAHRFNEKNCNGQCRFCNDRMKGEADKHAIYIDKKYGKGTAEFLRGTENRLGDLARFEYIELIKEYKQKAKNEAKKRGINIYGSIP